MASSAPSTCQPPGDDHGQASINIRRLQCPHPIIAPNVWGLPKEQPAYLDVHVNLKHAFRTAASADALDGSTIHYGQLAKRIREACAPSLDALDVLSRAQDNVDMMGYDTSMSPITSSTRIELILPKASMYSEELRLSMWYDLDNLRLTEGSGVVCEFRDLRFMGLIGVNDYERTAKQPIIATLSVAVQTYDIYVATDDRMERLAFLFSLENVLADVVQESEVETLESLIVVATNALLDALTKRGFTNAEVSLQLEKPKAIVFADAAVVELRRSNAVTKQEHISAAQRSPIQNANPLHIIKPYF